MSRWGSVSKGVLVLLASILLGGCLSPPSDVGSLATRDASVRALDVAALLGDERTQWAWLLPSYVGQTFNLQGAIRVEGEGLAGSCGLFVLGGASYAYIVSNDGAIVSESSTGTTVTSPVLLEHGAMVYLETTALALSPIPLLVSVSGQREVRDFGTIEVSSSEPFTVEHLGGAGNACAPSLSELDGGSYLETWEARMASGLSMGWAEPRASLFYVKVKNDLEHEIVIHDGGRELWADRKSVGSSPVDVARKFLVKDPDPLLKVVGFRGGATSHFSAMRVPIPEPFVQRFEGAAGFEELGGGSSGTRERAGALIP